MPVEYSDQDAAVLNGAHKLMDQLLSNPATKHVVEAAIKKIHPTVTTEVDRAAPIINAVRHVNQKVDQTVNWLKAREIDHNLKGKFDSLQRDYGYTDEGIEEIKRLMVAEKIPSPDAAAALFDRRNPPKAQEPSLFSPTDWGFGRVPEDEDAKLLWKNEDAWAEKQAKKVLQEISKGTYNERD